MVVEQEKALLFTEFYKIDPRIYGAWKDEDELQQENVMWAHIYGNIAYPRI